ncbi:MAG: hypothetical protein ABIY70_05110 [Capsulimonas sp.]|uniref:hypothetical protein n=1 Tax=Capsulimonas sp. TaxID=2494211 RepID=UPI003263CBA2
MSLIASEQAVSRELNAGETLLWTGRPDPVRSMRSSLGHFVFGVVWTAFIINAIVVSHSGNRGESGLGRLFGMYGLIFDLFFVPFILAGVWLLSHPLLTYRFALNTIYAITNKRVLIISSGRNKKVCTYFTDSINMLERTDHANGTGTVAFNRDSDGDSHSVDAEFVGIPDARVVEELIQKTFDAPR